MICHPPPRLGPMQPRFNLKRIGPYLRNSPSPGEKECLRKFFNELGRHSVSNPYFDLGSNIFLVHACDHVIELHDARSSTPRVEHIYKTMV